MSRLDRNLPQLGSQFFLTDGGIETFLIFHWGAELPYFATYALLEDDASDGVRVMGSSLLLTHVWKSWRITENRPSDLTSLFQLILSSPDHTPDR